MNQRIHFSGQVARKVTTNKTAETVGHKSTRLTWHEHKAWKKLATAMQHRNIRCDLRLNAIPTSIPQIEWKRVRNCIMPGCEQSFAIIRTPEIIEIANWSSKRIELNKNSQESQEGKIQNAKSKRNKEKTKSSTNGRKYPESKQRIS